MKINLNLNPSAFNNKIWDKINDFTHDIEIHYGSRSSGKSYGLAERKTLHLILESNHTLVCIRKNYSDAKQSMMPLFTDHILPKFNLKKGTHYTVYKGDPCRINFYNGSQILFYGMSDPEKLKSLPSCDSIWLEEVNDFNEQDVDTIRGCLRGVSNLKQTLFSFNPSFPFWVKERYMDKFLEDGAMSGSFASESGEKILIEHSTWRDNKFNKMDEIIRRMNELKERDYYSWLVSSEGMWGSDSVENPILSVSEYKNSVTLHNTASTDGGIRIGIDVAHKGKDNTVIYLAKGKKVLDRTELKKNEIEDIVGRTQDLIDKYRHKGEFVQINIDSTGLGSFVPHEMFTRLRTDKNVYIFPINFAHSPKNKDKYSNIATEMYMELANMVTNEGLALPYYVELEKQLCLRTFTRDDKMRQKLLPKDKFKKQIGCSPDEADALALCMYKPAIERKYVPKKTKVSNITLK